MLHLLPHSEPERQPAPYAEAVSRLASVRHALRLISPDGGGPAPDHDDEIAAAWDSAGAAKRASFDRRSARLICATAAGVEALLIERDEEREPHQEASRLLADEIRRELHEVAGVILGR